MNAIIGAIAIKLCVTCRMFNSFCRNPVLENGVFRIRTTYINVLQDRLATIGNFLKTSA